MRAIAFSWWPNCHRRRKFQIHHGAVFMEFAKWECSMNVFGCILVLSILRS